VLAFSHRTNLPDVALENIDVFERFQLSAHYVLKTLPGTLSDTAGFKENDRFESYHPD
jgi:hypothetical protein